MKKSPVELKLESQELARLQMLEQAVDDDTRKKLLAEIKILNDMRDGLEQHRLETRNKFWEVIIRTGGPIVAWALLTYIGLSYEQLNGNPTGFTAKWLINRAPR